MSRLLSVRFFTLGCLMTMSAAALAQTGANPPEAANAQETDEEQAQSTPQDLGEMTIHGGMTRYSALKSDTPIMETARSVSVETAEQLRAKGALDLGDAYTYSAGVIGDTYGFATRGDWLKVRGLSVPEYRDSLQALFGNYNNVRPHIYTLEQVEILKGPASVLYGQGSPGGLVNIVSKQPRADQQNELFVQYGSFDHLQLGTDVGGVLNEDASLLYRVVAVGRDANTMVDHVNNDTVVLAPSLTWRPGLRTEITLLGNYQDTRSKAGAQFLPIAGTLTPAPNGQFIEDSTFLGEPEFDRYNTESQSVTLLANHIINTIWSFDVTARWTRGEADYRQAWPAFIGGSRYVFNDDGSLYENGTVPRTFYVSDAMSEQTAIDTRLHADFFDGWLDHEIMVGVQYQDVTTDNNSAYAFALGYDFATGGPDDTLGDTYWINVFNPVYGNVPGNDILDMFYNDAPEARTRDLGFYANDQISVGQWRLTAGLRYDEVTTDNGSTEQDDDAFSYSIGALYRFDNGIAPYASYAESFEPVVGTDTLTGEALRPQEGRQYEVGLKYEPTGGRSQLTLAAFDIEQSNLANPNGLPNAGSQQEGVAEFRGVELESVLDLGIVDLEANASRILSEDPNGRRYASVPENQASAWLNLKPITQWGGLRAGLGMRYVGESWDGADGLRTPSYTLADAMLGYPMGAWDFSVNVRNLTDKQYVATCLARGDCFVGDRRTVVGTLRRSF
ncbi:MAG: TonB-dependent siderophore receptor [Pseudomonadota bacterium]|nr:TonB-dependent siderophore receptor [Pseudomonadota bacterium]